MSNCPQCASPETECKDSRPVNYEGESSVRRRRQCKSCGFRFSTFELSKHYLTIDRPKKINQINKIKDLMRQIYVTMEEKVI